jgi:ribosomal protein S18 acetylase RimI-like enzyme
MVEVSLVPMTAPELEAFIEQEVADYAEQRVSEGWWGRHEAPERARDDLQTVVQWEHQAMTTDRQRLWTALNTDGAPVGWLWVKLAPAGTWAHRAFLCQMTVARELRRQGYGRAMLEALEALLAREGIEDLSLNVCDSNLPATHLYASAGYEPTARCETMRQLHKRLCPAGRQSTRTAS